MHSITLASITPPPLPQTRPPGNETDTVLLTPDEDRLCTLLDDFTKSLRTSQPDLTPVECRIAGGWVRDKLLGKDSNDIDIALSSMMGITFVKLFVPYLEEKGVQVRNVTKIAQNPEQSKHLETCTATLMGLAIDFVNLRSEEYAVGSRIPTKVAFGTPLQDALRRDLTINSLFYNVHTRVVEDHTGKGLTDLKNGIARTPLPPRETFLDDPLRVLRSIRFASRFGFSLEDRLEEAVKEKEVKEALVSKISRERVGDEVDKMLKGRDPLYSVRLIHELGIHEEIFWLSPSANPSPKPMDRRVGLVASALLASFLSSGGIPGLPEPDARLLAHSQSESGTRRRLFMAAALLPFALSTCPEKKRSVPAAEVVIREGLKIGSQNHYLGGVPLILQAHQVLSRPAMDKFTAHSSRRVSIGLALRDKRISNPLVESHWTSSVLFCLVQDLVALWDFEKGVLDAEQAALLINVYNTFVREVDRLALEPAIHASPILDGKTVCEILQAKPGPWVAGTLAKIVERQLEHPGETKAGCEEWLREETRSGRLSIGDVKRSTTGTEGKPKRVKV